MKRRKHRYGARTTASSFTKRMSQGGVSGGDVRGSGACPAEPPASYEERSDARFWRQVAENVRKRLG